SFFIVSGAANIQTFCLAAFVAAFGYGACQPVINALCMKAVPPGRRGAASSTSYLGIDLGSMMGPVLAGMIISRFGAASLLDGYIAMWRIMTVPIFLAIAIVIACRKKVLKIEAGFLGRK
ncbi:MAG: MFS transporter, partial [Clostridiales bacterium]|nr:MFS transporter [Clostridiales bacterium]